MKTSEHTLTLRIPTEIFVKLSQLATTNHTTISEIARDGILASFVPQSNEHLFLSRSSWAKAVKNRDGNACKECGDIYFIEAHHIVPVYQGGLNVLSNGISLCLECHTKKHRSDEYEKDSNDLLPSAWVKRFNRLKHNATGNDFWRIQLACFMTKRRNSGSSVVKKYVEKHLGNINEEIIIKTLITMCPNPETILNFSPIPPNNHNRIKDFPPPSFVE